MRILIVEDDLKGARILYKGLEEEGFTVDVAANSLEADRAVATASYDLVILDWLLPGKQGIEICRDLRLADASIPILMLTAKDDLSDRVAGLNAGADDYLTKPYAFWELLARINALLRRSKNARPALVRVADLTIDAITHDVMRGGRVIELTRKEYAILIALAQDAGQVLSRSQLAKHLGHEDTATTSNLLDVYVSHLRKKIDDGASTPLIVTVRGQGYCLRGEPA